MRLRQLQFGYRLQITREHCASTAQRYVAASSSCEAVMCRVLYRSLKFTVELSLSFCFIPEAMENSVVRLPPGFCWNQCTVLTAAEKLHLRVELAPSWSFKIEGLCSTFTPLTPAWKEKNKHMMSLRGHGWGFQTRKLSQEHLRMKDHLEAPGQLSPLPPTDSCGHSPAPSLG